ncbi:MAG: tyrosine-type recombinase/integrase, partial [bacterium]
ALEKSGISDFKFHDLRHTFASHYVMNGGDLISLKYILGHSTLKMVERYSHLTSSYRVKMMNNLRGKFEISRIYPDAKLLGENERNERKKEAS